MKQSPARVNKTEPNTQDKKMTFMQRMRKALSRTGSDLGNLFLGAKEIDQDLLEELETPLLMADVGIEATDTIIQALPRRLIESSLMMPKR